MTNDTQAPTKPSKSAAVIKLLSRAKGATSAELTAATNWQPHSVRAFLSGLRKKGQVLEREARKSGEAAYRLVGSGRREPVPAISAPAVNSAQMSSAEPAVNPIASTLAA